MIVLDWTAGGLERPARQVALLFGLGLIGSAILSALLRRVTARQRKLPLSWQPVGDPVTETGQILSVVRDLVGAFQGERTRIDIVWSAGRAGFASSRADLVAEESAFTAVLDLSRRICDLTECSSFHFLSSAGGLFEGQRNIDATHTPAPLRPYGFAKLEQEEGLGDLRQGMAAHIYRPSSVYGYTSARGRIGLVAALIRNAIRYQTTRIFGAYDTIRDYVFADDVGGFIADRIIGPRRDGTICLLASGKPTSMKELTSIVEDVLQRQLYLQFEPEPSNALNNSFRPSSLPKGWRTTPLRIGVHKTAARIMSAYRVPLR